ncbi:MAG: PfkB family carbohydrate kinase [Sedimenticolaceae bacterium]
MARVLCVGIATLDIINRVEEYPAEDTEVRVLAQSQRLGGNAANTAIVLAQMGVQAFWVGNLAQPAEIAERGFAGHGVDASLAARIPAAAMPTSYILLSEATGSRSIAHYRDLPEYRAEDFCKLDLRSFDWVHFEGRAIDELAPMLQRARDECGLPASLEVEKPREGIHELFEQADLLLFSRDYALAQGFSDATGLLGSLPSGLVATCTWGAQGAWAIDPDGRVFHSAAPPLESVVDTLGAGDVFNAAMIHALSRGRTMEQALHEAVGLASSKCTHEGLHLGNA